MFLIRISFLIFNSNSPSGRRYRNRKEMQERLKEEDFPELADHLNGLLDFSAHRKQARRCGWDSSSQTTPSVNICHRLKGIFV
jgi:hypothetical protein